MGMFDKFFEYLGFDRKTDYGAYNNGNSPFEPAYSQEEYSTELAETPNTVPFSSYSADGVQYHNIPGSVKIVYDGVLAKSGAEEIYAVIGYGDNDNWEDVDYFPMMKTAENTFEVLADRKRPENVNVAFKDAAGNWDNNSGTNYVFPNDSSNNFEGSH